MGTSINSGRPSSHCDRISIVALIVTIISAILSFTSQTYAAEFCPTMAQVVSVQGIVELRRANQANWRPAAMNTLLCAGDAIRARSHSRAALRLSNESMLRLDQKSTISFPTMQADKSTSLLDLLNGAIHVITRTPRPFRVRTPYVSAAVDGTEFFVEVDESSTRLIVYEGQVTASNDQGSLSLLDNEAAIIFKDQAPQKEVIIHPTDAVQWALHYPTIIDDLSGHSSQDIHSASFLIHQAGQLLTVGRVDEATNIIEQALRFESNNSGAHALQAIISVTQNDKEQALSFAMQAVELDSASSAAKLALSYAQQAHFYIEDALITTHEAVKLNSRNALAWARLSELQMSAGYIDRALDAAQQAVSLNPDIAKTHTVLGFAYLLQINTDDAKTVFIEAILLDQADPMPRLGLGLALIREGELEAGRIELEIAASLDPANSLIRSYLGKAYFEEKRYSLAGTQFDLAKERDPSDPTPWFYDAIQKQTQNRPVEALRDIQKSIKLNGNRAVYRSKLLLDQDQAGRGSSLARIYDNLGFESRALMETAKSLSVDPSNHSAHRFLSDAYVNIPRHEIARVSELLQAQLMQPVNVNPVQPHLTVADLNIITNTGPAVAGFNEFTPLMERNKPQLVASGIAGSNNTFGNEVVASVLYDRASVSVGQYHLQSDGFRKNNGQNHDIYNAFMQYVVTPKLNIQAEIRRRETQHGDLLLDFDQNAFRNNWQRNIKENLARIGAKYELSSNQDLIASGRYIDRHENSDSFSLKNAGFQLEAQHLLRHQYFNTILGGGVYRFDWVQENNGVRQELPFKVMDRKNAYFYTHINYHHNLNLTLGLSFDSFTSTFTGSRKDHINPKFGLQWNVLDNLRLRAAWFETTKSHLIAQQTLEPTQVAGFNQFFDDINGTSARRMGVGLDYHATQAFYGGVEASKRELRTKTSIKSGTEYLYRSYLYWTPHPHWAIKGEFQFERYKRAHENTLIRNKDPIRIHTLSAPVSVEYFHPSGLFSGVTGTFVEQDLTREGDLGKERNPKTTNSGIDAFFLLDAMLGYRLPNRRGILNLEGRNLLDKSFYYRNINNFNPSEPINSRFIPERTFFARLTLNF